MESTLPAGLGYLFLILGITVLAAGAYGVFLVVAVKRDPLLNGLKKHWQRSGHQIGVVLNRPIRKSEFLKAYEAHLGLTETKP